MSETALNVIVAAVGTGWIEAPLDRQIGFASVTSVVSVDLITSLIAFGLGIIARLKWSPRTAKWTWLAGVVWLGFGVFRGEAVWEISGRGSVLSDDRAMAWMIYTLPSIRCVAYSVGAAIIGLHIRGGRLRL